MLAPALWDPPVVDWRCLPGVLGLLLATGCADDATNVVSETDSTTTGGEAGDETRSLDTTEAGSGTTQTGGTTAASDETGSSSMGNTSSSSDGSSTGPECELDADCDDNNGCTANRCTAGACESSPTETSSCRPAIEVETPARAATLLGVPAGVVQVTGTVAAGYGDIESLTLNGAEIAVRVDGSFSTAVDPEVGGNLLDLVATDSNGWQRRRVQSFLWSPSYLAPTSPMDGATPQGVVVHLDQQSLDDNDRSSPINDLASVLQLAVDDVDIAQYVDPATRITSSSGYDVFLISMAASSRTVTLEANDTGMHVVTRLNGLAGELVFDCVTVTCQTAGGDGTGDITMNYIEAAADLVVTVTPQNTLEVEVQDVQTSVVGLAITSNHVWTTFLIAIIEPFLVGGVVADIEAELSTTTIDVLGPLAGEGLSQLDVGTTVEFPNLDDPVDPVEVQLATDVGASEFHDGVAPPTPSPPQSGLITFRGGGYAAPRTTPYDNLGIPQRSGCDAVGPPVNVPRQDLLEIGLTDDVLNQLMYGSWRGGLLEFPLPLDLGAIGDVTDVVVTVSGMLAPTASDCNATGDLLAQLGDLRIDASMSIDGVPVDFVAFASMSLVVEIDATDAGLVITMPSVDWIETELTVSDDDLISAEDEIADLVEAALSEQLVAALGGGLSPIALPEIDLSTSLGVPPGLAVLTMTVDQLEHVPGVTVVSGHW